jgi:hypothetical protein
MFRLDGYDHNREECPNQEGTFTEDHQQDHSVRQEEVHQEEVHQEEVHPEVCQCLFLPHQLSEAQEMTSWWEIHQLSRTRSFIRFSELESLSLDMIRWLVT